MISRLTHLRKFSPHPLTWFEATDACTYALGGVFFNSRGDAFVWQWPLLPTLRQLVRTNNNLTGTISINVLKLAAHVN